MRRRSTGLSCPTDMTVSYDMLPSAYVPTGMAAFIRHFAVPLPSLPGGASDAHASLVADSLTAIGL